MLFKITDEHGNTSDVPTTSAEATSSNETQQPGEGVDNRAKEPSATTSSAAAAAAAAATATATGDGKASEMGAAEPRKEGGSASIVKDENGFEYFRCPVCQLTYNYMNTLRAHMRSHNVEAPYTCAKCNESFHFACELEYHCQQHAKIKGYRCECGRTFFTYTEMLHHRHPDEDGVEPPSAHDVAMAELTAKVARVVAPSGWAGDDSAPPAFKLEGYEPRHQMKVYSEVRTRPYICEYCSKSYPDSRSLCYHMYSHRGERNFNPRSSRYLLSRDPTPAGQLTNPFHDYMRNRRIHSPSLVSSSVASQIDDAFDDDVESSVF